MNKCLLGHPETMGHRQDFEQTGLPSVEEEKTFLYLSEIPLAGLRIKLTRDGLIGEKPKFNYVCTEAQ